MIAKKEKKKSSHQSVGVECAGKRKSANGRTYHQFSQLQFLVRKALLRHFDHLLRFIDHPLLHANACNKTRLMSEQSITFPRTCAHAHLIATATDVIHAPCS